MRDAMPSGGAACRECRRGAAALALPHDFDLVLSEVIMPGEIDGLMLASHLRRLQPALPVVLVSGYSETAALASDFKVLRKPCTEDELLQALVEALVAARNRMPSTTTA